MSSISAPPIPPSLPWDHPPSLRSPDIPVRLAGTSPSSRHPGSGRVRCPLGRGSHGREGDGGGYTVLRNPGFAVVFLTGVLLLTQGGCATGGSAGKGAGAVQSSEASAPVRSVIAGVPFLPQEDDTCGPSSLAMVLGFLGQDVETSEIVRETRTAGLKGTLITDLTSAARRRGFAAEVADLDLPRLRERISAGVPVILLVDLGIWSWSRPHYLVAYGWTPEGVVAHSGRERGKVIPFSTLDAEWAKMGRLAIIVDRKGAR